MWKKSHRDHLSTNGFPTSKTCVFKMPTLHANPQPNRHTQQTLIKFEKLLQMPRKENINLKIPNVNLTLKKENKETATAAIANQNQVIYQPKSIHPDQRTPPQTNLRGHFLSLMFRHCAASCTTCGNPKRSLVPTCFSMVFYCLVTLVNLASPACNPFPTCRLCNMQRAPR